MTPRLLLLSAVVGAAPALNNLSLSLNQLGFYQVVKLLVTPAIVALEAYLYAEEFWVDGDEVDGVYVTEESSEPGL